MVFDVLPNDFNRIQLRAVGRQVHQHQTVVNQPVIEFLRIDVVMERGIVQNHKRQRHPLFAVGNTVDQSDDGLAADRVGMQLMPQLPAGIVQRAHRIHPLAREASIRRVRFALGIPRALDVGDVGETAFIQIKQADLAGTRGILAVFQIDAGGVEAFRAASFFNDSRVRVNDSPRARKPADRRSKLKSDASG